MIPFYLMYMQIFSVGKIMIRSSIMKSRTHTFLLKVHIYKLFYVRIHIKYKIYYNKNIYLHSIITIFRERDLKQRRNDYMKKKIRRKKIGGKILIELNFVFKLWLVGCQEIYE